MIVPILLVCWGFGQAVLAGPPESTVTVIPIGEVEQTENDLNPPESRADLCDALLPGDHFRGELTNALELNQLSTDQME